MIEKRLGMKYFKDPLHKQTPYDQFRVGPDTTVNQIKKKYKELRGKLYKEKKYEHLKKLNEAKDALITTDERLKIDLFYYCVPERKGLKKGNENEEAVSK